MFGFINSNVRFKVLDEEIRLMKLYRIIFALLLIQFACLSFSQDYATDDYYEDEYSDESEGTVDYEDDYQDDYPEDYADEGEYQENYQDNYSEDYADEEPYEDDYQDGNSEYYEDEGQYQDGNSEYYEDEGLYQDDYTEDYTSEDEYQDEYSEGYADEEQYQDDYQDSNSEYYEDEGQYQDEYQDDNSEYYEDEEQYQDQQQSEQEYYQNDSIQSNQQSQSSDTFNNQPVEQTQQPNQQSSQHQTQQTTQATNNQDNQNNQTQQALAGMLNEIKADEANWRDLFKNNQKFDPEEMATLCLTQLGGNNCDVFVLKAMVAFKYTKTGQVNPTQEEWDAVRSVANRAASDCKENCLKAPVQALSGAMEDIKANEETWRNMFKNEDSFDAEKMARMCVQQQMSADCGGFVMMAKMAFQYTKTGNFNIQQEEIDALKPVIARAAPNCKQNCIKDQMLQQRIGNIMDRLNQIKNFDPQEQWDNISQRTSGSDICKLYTFQQMSGFWVNAADTNDPTDNRNNKEWMTNWAANIDAFMKQKSRELSNSPFFKATQDRMNSIPKEQKGEAIRQFLRDECRQ